MNRSGFSRHYLTSAMAIAAVTIGHPLPAMAGGAGWRPTYDIIMMWVNFFILVALLIKFLGPPLRKFLKAEKDALKNTLETLEADKTRVEEDIQALRDTLEDRKQRAAALHQRIVGQGRKERQEVVEAARCEAERRLTKARQLIEARQQEACQAIRSEMVDIAVRRAMEELPGRITPQLEQALAKQFLTSISGKAKRA